MTETPQRAIRIGSTCMAVPPESKESGPVYRAGPIGEPRARGVSWAAKIIRLAMFGGKGPLAAHPVWYLGANGPPIAPRRLNCPETLSLQGHPMEGWLCCLGGC